MRILDIALMEHIVTKGNRRPTVWATYFHGSIRKNTSKTRG
jgi:hypothetical protein